jgi:mycofactocin precursor
MRTDELTTTLPPETETETETENDAEAGTGVAAPEEMLIEEISIDGMCGVY